MGRVPTDSPEFTANMAGADRLAWARRVATVAAVVFAATRGFGPFEHSFASGLVAFAAGVVAYEVAFAAPGSFLVPLARRANMQSRPTDSAQFDRDVVRFIGRARPRNSYSASPRCSLS
jgi:hypothetical protein